MPVQYGTDLIERFGLAAGIGEDFGQVNCFLLTTELGKEREDPIRVIIGPAGETTAQQAVAPETWQCNNAWLGEIGGRNEHSIAYTIKILDIGAGAGVVTQLGAAVGAGLYHSPEFVPIVGGGEVGDVMFAGIGAALVLGGVGEVGLPDGGQAAFASVAPCGQTLMIAGTLVSLEEGSALRQLGVIIFGLLAEKGAQLEVEEVEAAVLIAGDKTAEALKGIADSVGVSAGERA